MCYLYTFWVIIYYENAKYEKRRLSLAPCSCVQGVGAAPPGSEGCVSLVRSAQQVSVNIC